MTTGRAFGLDDLTMLLGLDLADPADEGDIGRRCAWSPTSRVEPAPHATSRRADLPVRVQSRRTTNWPEKEHQR